MSAQKIIPGLWIGSHPEARGNFEQIDVWVPCAVELQPGREMRIPGTDIYRCPLYDDGFMMDDHEEERVGKVSKKAARDLQSGANVLVTCAMGQNRSALVVAMILLTLYDATPDEVIEFIRARRTDLPDGRVALANEEFVLYLQDLGRFKRNPFRSKAQWRACLAAQDPDWDCNEWAVVSQPYEQLPERLRKNGKSNEEVLREWKKLVNMSPRELREFMASDYGKAAGLSRSEASQQGIRSGQDSARAILRMKEKGPKNWTEKDWDWARAQINFITRMRGVKGPFFDRRGEPTRKLTSLLIWGHNPI